MSKSNIARQLAQVQPGTLHAVSNSQSKKRRGNQAVGKRAKVKKRSENERTISTQADDHGIAGAGAGIARRAEGEECEELNHLTPPVSCGKLPLQPNSPQRHSYPERWRDRPCETSTTTAQADGAKSGSRGNSRSYPNSGR